MDLSQAIEDELQVSGDDLQATWDKIQPFGDKMLTIGDDLQAPQQLTGDKIQASGIVTGYCR